LSVVPQRLFCLLEFRYQIIMVHEVAILPCVKANRGVLSKVSELRCGYERAEPYFRAGPHHPHVSKSPRKYSRVKQPEHFQGGARLGYDRASDSGMVVIPRTDVFWRSSSAVNPSPCSTCTYASVLRRRIGWRLYYCRSLSPVVA
jgi:hypothetical protein